MLNASTNITNSTTIANPIHHIDFTTSEQLGLSFILCIIICMSLYGNVGMILVLRTNKKMWTSTYILIGNIAISGLLVTLLATPLSFASLLMRRWPFQDGFVCKLSAFVNATLLLVKIFTHTTISIDKYFAVVKPYSRTMTTDRTKKILLTIWLLAALVSLGPLLNFGRYSFGSHILACGVAFPTNRLEKIYLLLLTTVAFVVPVTLMTYMYVHIIVSMRQHAQRLGHSSNSSSSSLLEGVTLQRKLLITALCSLSSFIVCWTPFCVLVIMGMVMGSRHGLPRGLGAAAYWCGFSYNAVNPVIFIVLCPRFREGLMPKACM